MSLSRGDTLYALNPDAAVLPASTQKLLTSALAFERLGPNFRFTTEVLHDGALSDGVVRGNLYLRGAGDPSLTNRFHRGDADAPMTALAKRVAGGGVRRVTGALVGDASAFDTATVPAGWQTRYLGAAYAARVSALSLNENLVWIAVRPVGKTASVTLEPATTVLPVVNLVRVVGGRGGRISARRTAQNTIEVRGTIGASSGTLKYSLVVEDPASFTTGALRAALMKEGIVVDGGTQLGATPANATRVAALESASVAEIATMMNRESNNHYAELLFRNAGRGPKGEAVGSAATANEVLRTFFTTRVGATPDAVAAADGSGLSVLDRVTARAMVQLLHYAHEAPWASTFHASLPVAGISETLRGRMRGSPAQGNLHAKTGTTNDVASLAGYVTARNGEVLAFAFIYNGRDRWGARSTMDAMGPTLAEFVR